MKRKTLSDKKKKDEELDQDGRAGAAKPAKRRRLTRAEEEEAREGRSRRKIELMNEKEFLQQIQAESKRSDALFDLRPSFVPLGIPDVSFRIE